MNSKANKIIKIFCRRSNNNSLLRKNIPRKISGLNNEKGSLYSAPSLGALPFYINIKKNINKLKGRNTFQAMSINKS